MTSGPDRKAGKTPVIGQEWADENAGNSGPLHRATAIVIRINFTLMAD